ncbi:MAG: 3-methyl-2-oxobutanoate hydroxymethyltransferase [Planctomycetia bacterium]|nr:3-methyl-2-oxobutanoate hydroxymethyltransferase [Planctomycetia bacterium]
MTSKFEKVKASQLLTMKETGKKIVMMTAYDFPTAQILDEAGVDILLVGDSLGTVIQGHETTLPVTLDQMIYHAEMVTRAAKRAFVVVDMPFPYCQLGPDEAVRAAARVIKETGANGVKIEGGQDRIATISAVIQAGIPVMGHCGLMPQSIRKLGGYKIQRNPDQLDNDLQSLQENGVFAAVLECVPKQLSFKMSQKYKIPLIGIGAGKGCDGQVLVFHDFALWAAKEPQELPKHARVYVNLHEIILKAVQNFAKDVRSSDFPSDSESFD